MSRREIDEQDTHNKTMANSRVRTRHPFVKPRWGLALLWFLPRVRRCASTLGCGVKHLRCWIVIALALAVSVKHLHAEGTSAGPAVPEAAKVVGPDQCAKCHQPEVQQWMRTPHF